MTKKPAWKVIPYTNGYFQISDQGQIRKIRKEFKDFNIFKISEDKYESVLLEESRSKLDETCVISYPSVKIKTIFGIKKAPISTLLFEAFHGIYELNYSQLIHLDGNELNNDIDNVILSDASITFDYLRFLRNNPEHFIVKKSNHKTILSLFKKGVVNVSVYDKEGRRVHVFNSSKEASLNLNIDRQVLLKALKAQKYLHYKDHVYKYGYGPQFIDLHLIFENKIVLESKPTNMNAKRVFKYSKDGKLHAIYNNIYEAAISNKLDVNVLHTSILKISVLKDAIWILE